MHHYFALGAGLLSLGLVASIYYCNILARPRSWLRGDVLATILLSLLTGLFPLAAGAALVGLWQAATHGLSLQTVAFASVDLAAVASVLATSLLFRALVKATYRRIRPGATVVPLPTTPTDMVLPQQAT